ncbi:MAG: sigma-70 family RNA polymerase sigma factor [Opitutaceae bacterium]|nr:sigma-70 family RNA polymerase sigma factor [Opitutaceae bacterium]
MMTDRELLQRYCEFTSQEAFAELVRRHVNLVYGAAFRQLCGNEALAEEVTQTVFTVLAQRAATITDFTHLSSWLYTTTRFTVSHTVRSERRRQERERKAQIMHAVLNAPDSGEPMNVSAEIVDEALERLDDAERAAVLLRFFEGQSFASIGTSMHLTEDAARMRVARALEKVRELFARRGITSSAAARGAALSGHAIAAPATLAASVSTVALAGSTIGIAAVGAKLGVFTFMTTSKAGMWTAGAVSLLALGYSGFQQREATRRERELMAVSAERERLNHELTQSEQRARRLEQRLAQTEQRVTDLQRKPETQVTSKAPKPIAPTPAPTDEARARSKAKMAQMRPLLEAGQPIKAAVIFTVNGQAVSHPVEFVMGKETRIDTPEDGTYVVTPSLNADGSVKYALGVVRKNTAAGAEEIVMLPAVTQTPWDPFVLRSGGKIVAIDPDKTEP